VLFFPSLFFFHLANKPLSTLRVGTDCSRISSRARGTLAMESTLAHGNCGASLAAAPIFEVCAFLSVYHSSAE
jgi:hypothetical protein